MGAPLRVLLARGVVRWLFKGCAFDVHACDPVEDADGEMVKGGALLADLLWPGAPL